MAILIHPLCIAEDEGDADPYLNMPLIAWENLFERGLATASGETADGFLANAWSGTYDFWVPPVMPAWARVDLASAAPADCLGVAGHTLGSTLTTVICEYLEDGEWIEAASAIPQDDTAFILVFPEIHAAAWRVRLEGTRSPAIGTMMLGRSLVMEGGVQGDHVPISIADRTELLVNVSLGGHVVGRSVIRRGAEETIAFAPMTTGWVRSEFEPFRRHFNEGRPFFFAWAPVAWPNDVALCQRRGGDGTEIRPEHRGMFGGAMWVEMQVEAYP